MECSLCYAVDTDVYYQRPDSDFGKKIYYKCRNCRLIYLDNQFFLSSNDEKARYDTHQNNPEDDAYRNFLKQVTDPLVQHLNKESKGLDYGSGPGPTISALMSENGHCVTNYDPYYSTNKAVLNEQYDFITCTETVEHFYSPGNEFKKFDNLLKQNSFLAIMTNIYDAKKIDFERWWYPKDPTHVCFYSLETFRWISKKYNWKLEPQSKNVIFFRKGGLDGDV